MGSLLFRYLIGYALSGLDRTPYEYTMPSTPQAFVPAWWLPGPHLQTLWPALCRRIPKLEVQRQRLATPDGDFLDLDWFGPAGKPLAILLHGLSGSSRSIYILGMQQALARSGWGSVALNFRGCSGHPNDTARCYHSGETSDLDFVYRWIRAHHPERSIAVIGFSLGGNVLLKWLGEQGSARDVLAAVAVSAPLQLNLCADRLDQGLSRLYRNSLLAELKAFVHWKRVHLSRQGRAEEAEKLAALGDLSDIQSFWQYDDRVVARLYGFRDAAHYYQSSSARAYLNGIQRPTLIIHARNDPFMTPSVVPKESELSPWVQMELSGDGGHVGFVGGTVPGRPCYWLETRIPAFLMSRLESPC